MPQTDAEQAAAARKYGLTPEEYQPYPDDGFGLGDYPKLPAIGDASKSPHENWDIPGMKRNFGEPVSVRIEFECSVLSLIVSW